MRIDFAPPDFPTPPDAWVQEEDTYLVMSADPVNIKPSPFSLATLQDQAQSFDTTPPGNIIVRDGNPSTVLAVIHDLDQKPSWKEQWVDSVLGSIFVEAARRRWKIIALPCLAGVHGSMTMVRFVELLSEAFHRIEPDCVTNLWVKEPTPPGISIWTHINATHL